MRIVLLLAVLFVAAWLPVALAAGLPTTANTSLLMHYRGRRRAQNLPGELDEMEWDTTWMGVKQMQALLLREGTTECCPSVEELTTPKAGKDRFGNFVFLQSVDDGLNEAQTFYEASCPKSVLGKPCKFLDQRIHSQSKCEQKRSFAYAMVYNHSVNGQPQVRLDHIQVNAGCVCKVKPKRGRHHKGRQRAAAAAAAGHHHKKLD